MQVPKEKVIEDMANQVLDDSLRYHVKAIGRITGRRTVIYGRKHKELLIGILIGIGIGFAILSGYWLPQIIDRFTYTPSIDTSFVSQTADEELVDTSLVANFTEAEWKSATPFGFKFEGRNISSNAAVNTFECQLNEAGFESCPSQLTYTGLKTGSYILEVRAVANNSKDPTPAVWMWSVK